MRKKKLPVAGFSTKGEVWLAKEFAGANGESLANEVGEQSLGIIMTEFEKI